MVYTVTVNPSVDYIMHVGTLEEGMVNRSSSEELYIGGKGINVSFVLKEFGIDSVALGFCAGFTGDYIKEKLLEYGIKEEMITLKNGNTRINVKLKGQAETEINGQGPDISTESLEELYKILDKMKDGDYLVLSGSIPKTLSDDTYSNILKKINGKNIKTVVDASGQLLLKTLDENPFLIKPNIYELADLFSVNINSADAAALYAGKLVERGAQNVIVSMGGNGAVFVNKDHNIYRNAKKGKVVNSTGAGDSMVAGFIGSYIRNGDFEKAFETAVETGTIAAFSAGLPCKEQLSDLI